LFIDSYFISLKKIKIDKNRKLSGKLEDKALSIKGFHGNFIILF